MSKTHSTPTPEQRANSIVKETALGADERDALYVTIVKSLRSIDRIAFHLALGEASTARSLRERFEGEMALLDHIGWDPKSTRTRFPISMRAERLQQVMLPLLEETHAAVTSPEITALQIAEKVCENLTQQATARILASSDAQ
jgi:hypothetical protein